MHLGALTLLPPGALAPLQGHCFCSCLLCECRSLHRTSAPLLPAPKREAADLHCCGETGAA